METVQVHVDLLFFGCSQVKLNREEESRHDGGTDARGDGEQRLGAKPGRRPSRDLLRHFDAHVPEQLQPAAPTATPAHRLLVQKPTRATGTRQRGEGADLRQGVPHNGHNVRQHHLQRLPRTVEG